MITIFIENLTLEGIHGVTAKEQKRVQPFRMDIEVETELSAQPTDTITETADYRLMKQVAERVVTKERHALLETVAERIASEILADLPVQQVTVSVRKLIIWQSGVPGVKISCTRN